MDDAKPPTPGEIANDGTRGFLGRALAWRRVSRDPAPEDEEGLAKRGHRRMVGGNWDLLGRLQFDFMVARGLEPHHVLLDVGCGSFRGGRHFIPYLEPGHYMGVEKQRVLVERGRAEEVPPDVWEAKRPEVVITETFDFSALSRRPDFALAQSVFTHLTRRDIRACLRALRAVAGPETVLFASFAEGTAPTFHTLPSHSSRSFYYTRDELAAMGRREGWTMRYVGMWDHPHPNMRMAAFRPAGG